MKFTSYIWDFDGTLFDSYPHTAAAFEAILERDGIPYTHKTVLDCLMVTYKKAREHFGLSDQQYKDFLALEPIYAHKPIPAPFPGACAVLRAITEAGGKNFLYTLRNDLARAYLRWYGMDKYFAGVVDSTMHFPGKPAPDAVEHICRNYKLDKDQTVMIGDREMDVMSGVNAGVHGCLYLSWDVPAPETAAEITVRDMKSFAEAMEIELPEGAIPTEETLGGIRDAAAAAAQELCDAAKLTAGQTVVVGCSSSEIIGARIGSDSSLDIAYAVLDGLTSVFAPRGIHIAAQCCEHLNRALIMERSAAQGQILNVIPMPKAGGAFATAAHRRFADPVAVDHVQADAGLDIGGTMIGMHLKHVAVPLRLSVKTIGEAPLAAARVRAPFTGGERAAYDADLL